ncbi:MAG: hypothetical protein NC820_08175 [Candidatus Omnitrophica bacterium]|nr:hypothetical protein [Candidatus Omnitrophota bacterium]
MNTKNQLQKSDKLNEMFEEAIDERDKKSANALVKRIKNSWLIYRYACEIVKGKVNNKLEDVIAQNTANSFYYAQRILKGPFPKGENAIAKNSIYSYEYALEILKGPFPKGEDIIAENSDYSYLYARDILKGPFPKGEDAITKNDKICYLYAKDVLKDRFLKGEPNIIKSDYLNDYIKFLRSIKKLNEFLKDNPRLSRIIQKQKRVNIIKEIFQTPNLLNKIFREVIEEKNKKLANALVRYIKDPRLIYRYACEIVEGKVNNKLEDIIAQDTDCSYHYAKNILKSRFLKGEPAIVKGKLLGDYITFLKSINE